ncbi:MAG: hypothetical protein KKH88_02105 [Nanoarchaeota archaeon]|nr:hypothetical protein [Nanoarchaeota archaeon]
MVKKRLKNCDDSLAHTLTREEKVRGGKAKSKRKCFANSINAMKHGKYSKFGEQVATLCKDPYEFAQYLIRYLMKIEEMNLTKAERLQFLNTANGLFKTIHGQKIIESGEVQVEVKICKK